MHPELLEGKMMNFQFWVVLLLEMYWDRAVHNSLRGRYKQVVNNKAMVVEIDQ